VPERHARGGVDGTVAARDSEGSDTGAGDPLQLLGQPGRIVQHDDVRSRQRRPQLVAGMA
jgi:hypothetical protein